MKKQIIKITAISVITVFSLCNQGFAQSVGINTTGAAPKSSALLDVGTDVGAGAGVDTKGLLIPRVTLTQTSSNAPIGASIEISLLVYNTATVSDVTPGYYYWDGGKWVRLGSGSGSGSSGWLLTGNAGTIDDKNLSGNFIGTTDLVPLSFRVNNEHAGRIDKITNSTFFGYQSGNVNNSSNNTGFGNQTLLSNTNGATNTAIGNLTLSSNTTGNGNTAVGHWTMLINSTGTENTAIGWNALAYNQVGNYNTGLGTNAIISNKAGSNGTAVGFNAMANANNTTTPFTNYNVAVGFEALKGPISTSNTGNNNTAIGYQTLLNNSTGNFNTASGGQTLQNNAAGNNNTANGYSALSNITTGSDNAAFGYNAGLGAAGVNFTQCTFIGSTSFPVVARTNVTMLGYGIADAQCTGNNQVLLGNTAVTAIRSQVSGITTYSDARFKTNIKENVAGLDFILKLKPVTYNERPKELYKIWGTPDSLVNKIDFSETENKTYIGFLAQQVNEAAKECGFSFPGIDVPQNEKEVYSLRYVDFIMPMVKAIQELKAQNDSLKLENKTLQMVVDSQQSGNDKLQSEFVKLQSDYDIRFKKLESMLGLKAEK